MKCDIKREITGSMEKKYNEIKEIKKGLEKLGIKGEIYLEINEEDRKKYFEKPGIWEIEEYNPLKNILNIGENKNGKTRRISLFSKGYEKGEITIPYKHIEPILERIFKRKNIESEKEEELKNLKNPAMKRGGNEEEKEEKEKNEIEIEKFLFYNLNKDLKIRIKTN